MKKIYLLALMFLFPFYAFGAGFSLSLTGNTFSCSNGDSSDYMIQAYQPDGTAYNGINMLPNGDASTFCDENGYIYGYSGTDWLANFGTGLYGTWHFVELANSGGCNVSPAATYSECILSGDYVSDISVNFADPTPPPPPPETPDSGLTGIMSTSEGAFTSATGLAYSDVQTWSNTNLALVIGSGLGVLVSVMPWIIALLVIGAIVFFLYRGFRFFKH